MDLDNTYNPDGPFVFYQQVGLMADNPPLFRRLSVTNSLVGPAMEEEQCWRDSEWRTGYEHQLVCVIQPMGDF